MATEEFTEKWYKKIIRLLTQMICKDPKHPTRREIAIIKEEIESAKALTRELKNNQN